MIDHNGRRVRNPAEALQRRQEQANAARRGEPAPQPQTRIRAWEDQTVARRRRDTEDEFTRTLNEMLERSYVTANFSPAFTVTTATGRTGRTDGWQTIRMPTTPPIRNLDPFLLDEVQLQDRTIRADPFMQRRHVTWNDQQRDPHGLPDWTRRPIEPIGAVTGGIHPRFTAEYVPRRTRETSIIWGMKIKQRMLHAMAWNCRYRGKAYSYVPNVEAGIGLWSVGDHPVAEINLETTKVSSIHYPEDITPELMNRVRLLWRNLGLKAVRYKTKTFVHTGVVGKTLQAGERWRIHESYVQSQLPEDKREHVQQDLLESIEPKEKDISLMSKTIRERTKALKHVDFVSPSGRAFTHVLGTDGRTYNLNEPGAIPGIGTESDGAIAVEN